MVWQCRRKKSTFNLQSTKKRFLEPQQYAAIKRKRVLIMKRLATEYLSPDVNWEISLWYILQENRNCLSMAQKGITMMAYYKTAGD